jgi:hypothetical protein
MPTLLALVMVLARAPKSPGNRAPWATWESWRWLGTADERVLWAILAGAALLAAWGAWVGWTSWRRDP